MTESLDLQRAPLDVRTRQSPRAVWISLRGESDISNRGDLDGALNSLELEGVESVHLHVAGLDFCDVAGLRLLRAFAADMRRAGRKFVTCGATPVLRRLARLLEAEHELGLT
jgi:anti-anti-sigma factor